MPVSRQRKMQLRANLAGMCGSCMKNELSKHYPKSNRCDPCRAKLLLAIRKNKNIKCPQPHRQRPRCDEILAEVKNAPPSIFHDKDELEKLAKKLECPVGFLNYLRRQKLGIKFKIGRPKYETHPA